MLTKLVFPLAVLLAINQAHAADDDTVTTIVEVCSAAHSLCFATCKSKHGAKTSFNLNLALCEGDCSDNYFDCIGAPQASKKKKPPEGATATGGVDAGVGNVGDTKDGILPTSPYGSRIQKGGTRLP